MNFYSNIKMISKVSSLKLLPIGTFFTCVAWLGTNSLKYDPPWKSNSCWASKKFTACTGTRLSQPCSKYIQFTQSCTVLNSARHMKYATNFLLCISTISPVRHVLTATSLENNLDKLRKPRWKIRRGGIKWHLSPQLHLPWEMCSCRISEWAAHNEVHQSTDIYRKSHKLTHMVNCLIFQVGHSKSSWQITCHPRHLLGSNTKYNYVHGYDNSLINKVHIHAYIHIV